MAITYDYPYYNTILCQSSFQALEFYKVAMGFTEITDITKIPDTIQKKFIPSNQILPIKVIGMLHERRRPKVAPKKHILGHISRKALTNMFNVYHENFSSKLRLIPSCIQCRGSSIYYSGDTFLSNDIPDSFPYKFKDEAVNELYKAARTRTNTEHSEKILFEALNINLTEVQSMVICREILGIYLAKMLIHKYFSSIDTSKANPLEQFFNNNRKRDEEFFLTRPSSTKTFDDVVQFLIEIAWNLAKIDTTISKGNMAIETCLLLNLHMELRCVLEPKSKKMLTILTHPLRSKSCSMLNS